MGCVSLSLAGLVQDCENSKGGIKKVFITTDNPEAIVVEELVLFNNTSADWYEYNFKRNTGSFTQTLTIDQTNGVNFVTTELILQFNKADIVKRLEMSALAVNEVYVIILDSNGKYWYMGLDEPVTASAGTAQTGTAKTDGNFYQITLSADSKTWLYEVKEEDVPKFIPITNVLFTQNPRVTTVGFHSITYSVTPGDATEKYKIYSSDEEVIRVANYMNNTCSYEGLKTGSASLTIENSKGNILHSVFISITND